MSRSLESSEKRPKNLVELLCQRAHERGPERAYTFLADGEVEAGHLSWSELDAEARAIAAALRERRLTGERAVLLYPPGLDFISAFFGCLYAGVIAVPAYPPTSRRTLPRFAAIVRDARPAVALSTAEVIPRLERLCAREPELSGLDLLATDEVRGCGAALQPPAIGHESPAFLQYTSGSTSSPKGVVISHRNLMHNEELMRRAFELADDAVIVGWLPLFHDMGLIGNVLQPLYLGARCVLMSPMAFLRRPRRWLEAVTRYRATTSGGPNFAYELCARRIPAAERSDLDLSAWRVAFCGAEPVRASTLERFAQAFADRGFRREAFYPCYGLAEATLFVTGGTVSQNARVAAFDTAALVAHRVAEAPAGSGRALVGCGRTWAGQEIVIAEPETGRRSAVDEVGEIWVAGPSVAEGYWGQEEASEATFRARLAGEPEAGPFLRTGDLGFLRDGEVFVAGRLKDLVIIRGRNHHPQDLELTVEESHPAFEPGTVAAFSVEDEGGERLVVAGEVARRASFDVETVAAAVRRAIAEEHELLVDEVVLLRTGALPKTSSGKVQRHACRSGYLAGSLSVMGRSALADLEPEEPLEASHLGSPVPAAPRPAASKPADSRSTDSRSAESWPAESWPAEVPRRTAARDLRYEAARAVRGTAGGLDPQSPLTAQGLDSLAAVDLEQRLESRFGLSITAAELLAGATLAELERRWMEGLTGEGRPDEGRAETSARARAPEGDLPLSFGQEALWFLHRLAPRSGAYHIIAAARVRPAPDAAHLRRALTVLAERHPILRTTFHESPEGPVQRVGAEPLFELAERDVAPPEEVAMQLEREAYRPFDLAAGPLLRFVLFHDSEGGATLLLAVHHIIADFASLALLARELGALYGEALGGPPAEFEPLERTYFDYARRQREEIAGTQGEKLWSYWRDQLSALPAPLELTTDRPRPPAQTYRGGTVNLRLDAARLGQVEGLARARGATLFTTLLAAFQGFLSRVTGQRDLVVGAPTLGRDRAELGGLLGYFVNPVALRTVVDGRSSFTALLDRARACVQGALEHRGYPFPLLAEKLQPERDADRPPLFQVMLALQQAPHPAAPDLAAFALGQPGARLRWGGSELLSLPFAERAAPFDLVLRAAALEGELVLSFLYNSDLFDRTTARRLLGTFEILLAAAAERPLVRVDGLPLLSPAAGAQLKLEWNATAASVASQPLVHELVARQASRRGDAPAVVSESGWVSYGELERRANRLAHQLRRRGVGPESRVGVLVGRSAEMVVALLAVVKAGAAYVPLDPAYPAERLSFMIEDAGVELLLTERGRGLGLASPPAVLELDGEAAVLAAESPRPPEVAVEAAQLAYMIYTSGSTGQPKGVAVEHRGLCNLIGWHLATYDVRSCDRATQIASLAFDAVVWEIWPYLAAGARLYLPEETIRTSPEDLWDWFADREITLSFLPTPLAEAFLSARPTNGARLRLRALLTGGDRLRHRPSASLGDSVEEPELFNHYGPTENTVVATWGRVSASGAGLPSMGRPIAGVRVHLLSGELEPVPVATAGELCVGGASLARGYLGRPSLTAERFIPDPGGVEPGARLYRTGDLARWRRSGVIDFLGRTDHQVKLRGHRIELGEIEAALVGHPGVRSAVALLRPDLPGGPGLVAYVVPSSGAGTQGTGTPAAGTPAVGTPAAGELTEFLRQRLTAAMVPSFLVALEALPLTANGKVDRAALARREAPVAASTASAPGAAGAPSQIEDLLAEIYGELLGSPRAPRTASFFELGGHSLLATRLVSRIRQACGVELPLRAIFEAPSVARLGEKVERAMRAAAGAGAPPPIVPAPHGEAAPLSFAQRQLWLFDQQHPGSAAYNIPLAVHLEGDLNVGALRSALGAIVARHRVLRTAIRVTDASGPVQVIATADDPPLANVDLTALPAVRIAAESRRRAAVEAGRPFDLTAGGLLRASLLDCGDRTWMLILNLHHIVADGFSMVLFVEELNVFYRAFADRRPARLTPLPVQYTDYALWQEKWLRGAELERLLGFWRRRLAGAPPVCELPTDRPRPPHETFRGGCRRRPLSAALVARLEELSRRASVTPFMTWMAVFAVVLSRLSHQRELVLGTPIANRGRAELEGLIGFFVNTVVWRLEVAGDLPFEELLGRVRQVALDAYTHQELPFAKLVEELAPPRRPGRSPIFQILVVEQDTGGARFELPGVGATPIPLATGAAKLELTLRLILGGGGLALEAEHNAVLFDAVTVERWLRCCERLLAEAVEAPSSPVAALAFLGAVERHQLLAEWNDTQVAMPAPLLAVHELFERQASRTPDAVAVALGGAELHFRELDRQANQLAHYLRRQGVMRQSPVGLCLRRSPRVMVAILGILKAGGAYVPIDPEHPPARSARILIEAGVKWVVTQEALVAAMTPPGEPTPARFATVAIDTEAEAIAREPESPPAVRVEPRQLAYILHTSGSTGRPKGVMIEHRSLVHLIAALGRTVYRGLTSPLRVALNAPLTFDASVKQWVQVVAGHRLDLIPEKVRLDSPKLLAFLDRQGIEVLDTTPSQLRYLLSGGLQQGKGKSLVRVLVGGEDVPRDLFHQLATDGSERFWNVYGPTECTVDSTVAPIGAAVGPSLGRPLDNVRVYVLDAGLWPVPPGTHGELTIAGAGLARGYLAAPRQTAVRFVPDPQARLPGERLYRSGDLARLGHGGAIEFLGRVDHQVKLRGFRIELGEIEMTLAEHPAVREAAAAVRASEGGDEQLTAYVAGDPRALPGVDELRDDLREKLPGYMVPARIFCLEALPKTPAGKLDRLALPAPEGAEPAAESGAPRTPVEEVLAGMMAEILGLESVGIHDNFFELGGHSLLATEFVAMVQDAFELELEILPVLTESPTVAGLASYLLEDPERRRIVEEAVPLLLELAELPDVVEA